MGLGTRKWITPTEEWADFCARHELGGASPPDYYHSFLRPADGGVITPDLASRLAPTAGLRNRLVPECETIADRVVYQAIQRMIPNYTEYLGQVEDWITRAAAGEEE